MGYSTTYSLEWEVKDNLTYPACPHKNKPEAKFCSECGKPTSPVTITDKVGEYIKNHKEMSYALRPDGRSHTSCKWYDSENDCKALSKEFPSVLFTLEGEGEESGDVWRCYFLNGKSQHAQGVITFPPCTLT